MPDIHIRIEGRAGCITLARAESLNALTHAMCMEIDVALKDWSTADIDLVLIDAEGDRAFCAGGDIAEMYSTGTAGNYAYGQGFWRDEYRMNARLARYPKPVVTFLQGFTMGGGVGVGCHASHRIVGETSQIAMPECGIGLVPDVGGSLLLAKAPGHLGAYLGTTAARIGPGDAIRAGFADLYVPEREWAGIRQHLIDTGNTEIVASTALPAPDAPLGDVANAIERHFGSASLASVLDSLRSDDSAFAADTLKRMSRNSPLAMACALEMQHRLRTGPATLETALQLEYRFTARSMEHGDFLEGIRAAIIDKDRSPRWRFSAEEVTPEKVAAMLAPLDDAEWEYSREELQ